MAPEVELCFKVLFWVAESPDFNNKVDQLSVIKTIINHGLSCNGLYDAL